MDYIKEVLGVNSKIRKWDDSKNLPLYLQAKGEYYILTINSENLVLLKMENEKFDLKSFKNDIVKFKEQTSYDTVLWFESITSYQRKVLIKNRISFVVPGSQLYLPKLGICLKEYYENTVNITEKLTVKAQLILLYIIYNKGDDIFEQKELVQSLQISAMDVSRGVRTLKKLMLIDTFKEGNKQLIKSFSKGYDLYKKSKGYMISPVQEKVFVKPKNKYLNFMIAGEESLSHRTMLNEPNNRIRAIYKNHKEYIDPMDFVDPNWYKGKCIEIELWKYNPEVFSYNNEVDVISLELSLQNLNDERVEYELEKMMEDYGW